ncbi:MAG: hypothetical protein HEP71_32805 [Roseivirga sp.]|nr:hypothetical protein [Roseivirga sp.]
MRTNKLSKIWKNYLKELTIVVIGVTIAFWLEGLGARLKRHSLTEKVLENIENEMRYNLDRITSLTSFQDEILNSHDSLMTYNPDYSVQDFAARFMTISSNNSAYEISKSTNVLSEIEITMANEITRCYYIQDRLLSIEDRLMGFLNQPNGKSNQVYWLRILNGMEKELVDRYKRVIELIDQR